MFTLKTIQLVDDSRFMRTHIKRILNEADVQKIVEAENGIQAIEMYQMYSPDIVILDITMPLLNGIDTLKELLKMDREAKVIMCSAMGQQSIISEALKLGAKDFVVKPYFQNLVTIVNKYC